MKKISFAILLIVLFAVAIGFYLGREGPRNVSESAVASRTAPAVGINEQGSESKQAEDVNHELALLKGQVSRLAEELASLRREKGASSGLPPSSTDGGSPDLAAIGLPSANESAAEFGERKKKVKKEIPTQQ